MSTSGQEGTLSDSLAAALAAFQRALNDGRLDETVLDDLATLSQRAVTERDQFEQLVEHVPAVLYIDRVTDGVSGGYPTVYVGPQVEAVLGITRQEWIERDDLWREHMHPDDWPTISSEYDEYLRSGGVLVQEYRIIRPDNGVQVWVRDDCAMRVDSATGDRLVIGVMFDITAQKHLEEQLRAAEEKNRALIEQIPGIVWIEPLEGNPDPAFVSASVSEVFGVERQAWFATRWWEHHLHPDDRDRVLQSRRMTIAEAGKLHTEYRMTTVAGSEIWIEEVSQVVLHDGRPWILQGLLDDVTTRKYAEQRLEFRAFHDPLTGLANRPLFDQTLERALQRARREGFEVVVLFVDVDSFKQVNDVYGHEAGDEVLRVIAARLRQCARESDLVARRGGDEYLLLLTDLDAVSGISAEGEMALEHAAGAPAPERSRGDTVADMISGRVLESMKAPIELAAGTVTMSLSIGRCVYPWDASDMRSMMAAADASMYGEKSRPRSERRSSVAERRDLSPGRP